eukprot:CAMPEP_0204896338 /NCGR_PEP_ID=MMETSP1397-20131031/104_1 /ASSEMBLY_ACC=CAM_ASM_000891 /TAXON_ID=49980 /ORGANISM="Climacostomum Climacostomum virens, Strain Stock W-24" /LENGTH=372 /DNA_ID=CAMNT_0052063933 /DNA_START=109 /DNA_END=1226 /DNA_ORIENTATION=+
MKRSQDFIISVLSLTFCFLAAGVFQEDLYDDAEPFPHTEFFALIQVLTSYMTSAYLLNLSSTEYSHRKSLEKNDSSFDFTKKRTVFASFLENFKSSVLAADANQNSYEFKTFSATTLKLCHAFAYTAEIFVNNYALNYVSFTTHVLAKSCKVIPVLIGSILSNKAGRNMKQYVSVTLVAAGIFTFNYLDSESSEEDTLYGILLLALALGLDCASSFMVEKIRCLYSPSGLEIMHYCNLYGTFMTIPCYLYANSSQPLAILTFLKCELEHCPEHPLFLLPEHSRPTFRLQSNSPLRSGHSDDHNYSQEVQWSAAVFPDIPALLHYYSVGVHPPRPLRLHTRLLECFVQERQSASEVFQEDRSVSARDMPLGSP